MAKKGILINYEFCSGCHTCELACKAEHEFGEGQWGIKLAEFGPWQIEGTKKWAFDYLPFPTNQCDLCAKRTAKGKLPACVHNCYTKVMHYGDVEELSKIMVEKPRSVIYMPL